MDTLKCIVCGRWLLGEEVLWARESGALDSRYGSPYCMSCLHPEPPEGAAWIDSEGSLTTE